MNFSSCVSGNVLFFHFMFTSEPSEYVFLFIGAQISRMCFVLTDASGSD